ncbi:hypothetical protein BGW36DRAFT_386856 [Talaromyces proteolyticus]|uniref:Uncharacterized protein n=1 Tax=Talaromyces proteolyticus TaxID=1131652 RepID=A0AAD4KJZ3_9EURO|nr:uncharacterized protein BGW36DRAFT_386856 [Talaromyces proteolyticus]KAH8692033.1 hypothetical protein BGW36DRAFT_386856 [Talaromyces proteolyticus]
MSDTIAPAAGNPDDESRVPDRQGTPERPPYSPVTPVLSHLTPIPDGAAIIPPGPELSQTHPGIAYQNGMHPINRVYDGVQHDNFARVPVRPEPSPVPISESDNPDVIALRSAISILQVQKQRALNDIKALDQMKSAAAADPEGFAQELIAGRLAPQDQRDFLVDTSLPAEEEVEESDSSGNEEGRNTSSAKSLDEKFGKIPTPQNVVRMPPINWAKYHIVGEPLDRMHEEQRNRPLSGEPRQDPNQRAPEHMIAAPYRPLTDKLDSPAKSRSTKKDKKG